MMTTSNDDNVVVVVYGECCCGGGGEPDKGSPNKPTKRIPSCVVAKAHCYEEMEGEVVLVDDETFWIVDPAVFVEAKESFSGRCGFESPSENHALVQELGVAHDDVDDVQ